MSTFIAFLKSPLGGSPPIRSPLAVFLGVISAIALSSCERAQEDPFPVSITTQKVIPVAAQDRPGTQGSEGEPTQQTASRQLSPKVALNSGEVLLGVLNANLDLDAGDEQILVLRKTAASDTSIALAAVDYDAVRETYIRSWEASTNATNPKTFDMYLSDLVGDHSMEIVFKGRNLSGELTLDVFRKSPGMQLKFVEICQIVADGTVEIEESDRPESYQKGQRNGPSFPIVALMRDHDSGNPTDVVKHSYHWVYQKNRYVLFSIDKIPGKAIEDQKLRELYERRDALVFEGFLEGAWHHASAQSDDPNELILFGPADRRIYLYADDILNVLVWKDSYPTLADRLIIRTENESISAIQKSVSVTVESYSQIQVAVQGLDRWDYSVRKYTRIDKELHEFYPQQQSQAVLLDLELSGLYRSYSGTEVIFEPPYFTWLDGSRSYHGGFAVYSVGRDVLALKILDTNGLVVEDRTYLLEYTETRDENRIVRSISLTPCRLRFDGVEQTEEDGITLEQMEFIQSPSEG